MSQVESLESIPLEIFTRPYDWQTVDAVIRGTGGAVLRGLFDVREVAEFNKEVDGYLSAHSSAGLPGSGSESYDRFLGERTVRLHGLISKFPSAAGWIGREEIVDWVERMIEPVATSALINAAELIQIGPDEPCQYLHRDTDSWPLLSGRGQDLLGEHPFMVNAIVALDEFTRENGATHVVPDSWRWQRSRRAEPGEMFQVPIAAGDGLLFRGDILHGGGANTTTRPRRAVSLSYMAGWLRPVENSLLNIPVEQVKGLPERLQALLGYAAYDGTRDNGGLVGLYENGDPGVLLR